MLRGVRRSLVLLAAGTAFAGGSASAAQTAPGAATQPLPGNDGGAELRRHLADLAANPRSVTSLVGAGRAAIRVGDGEAALGFFARADEIAPNDARVKAGMASAFVLLGRGETALRFFAEAARFGAPEAEIARDRGLAYDLAGNPRRAQQDYATVLQRGEDAETRRRMALSLAISGHREAGLRALDPLLRNRDRASYRTRAFVLALTGDAAAAAQAVDSAMPGQGSAMAPFLARLAGLNPAQKAMAVHFGHFPADGRPVQMSQAVDTTAHPAAVALTGAAPTATTPGRFAQQVARPQQRTAAAQPTRRRVPLAQPVTRRDEELDRSARIGAGSRSEGRRPLAPVRGNAQAVREQEPARTAAASPPPQAQAPVQPIRVASAPPLEIPPAMRQDPPPTARPEPQSAVRKDPPSPVPQQPVPAPQQTPAAAAEPPTQEIPIVAQEAPPTVGRQDVPASAASEPPPATSAPSPAASPVVADFSDVAALVQALPTEEEPRRPTATPAHSTTPANRTATTPGRTTSAQLPPAQARASTPAAGRTAAASRTAARTPAPPPHPSRHWVQIANGAPGALAFELSRVRRAAPELLQGRTAWSAANGASGRLLVGPFASSAEARAFVNQLARKQVSAFPWTSEAGEEVARLPAR